MCAVTSSGVFNGGLLPPTRSQPRLGSVARSRVPTQIHIRGVCHWAGEPKSQTSRRVAEPTRHRARKSQTSKPASAASTPVAVPDAPAISMPRRRRTLPFAFSRRSLTYALGHSQWQKPPVSSKQVQPARTRSRGRRPREIRPPNHHRRSRTARALLPTVAARHCVVLTGTCSTGSRLERGTREPWLEFTQDSQPQRPHRK